VRAACADNSGEFPSSLTAPIQAAEDVVPKFDANYPAMGTANGTIIVKGTTTLSNGFTEVISGQVVVWPKGGGSIKSFALSRPVDVTIAGAFEKTLDGLTSGVEYNVVVTITAKKGAMNNSGSGDPARATAK
jgi:hypothetical protein